MKNNVDVKEWTEMFQAIGLDHAQMEDWHKVFETRHPLAHQSFLEWLGLPPERIAGIRAASQ